MRGGLVKSLALDKRREVAALPDLDLRAQRDERGRVVGLSEGQRVMLRAGLTKLRILEGQFASVDTSRRPKLTVICEDTAVTPFVGFLRQDGMSDEDVLRVDSGRKEEFPPKEWEQINERLFDVDRHEQPRVIVSVLMLREGFDVSSICVIVPLRSSQAQILLERTIGRGLRLMWRGNSEIDELKRETRERISQHLEPTNCFDVLFIVEHPAFGHEPPRGDVRDRIDRSSREPPDVRAVVDHRYPPPALRRWRRSTNTGTTSCSVPT